MPESPPETGLAILAGGGTMPARVSEAALALGRRIFVIGLEGNADPEVLAPYPHAFAPIGAVGRIRALLGVNGCQEVVMVGAMQRPSIFELRPDVEGMRLLARLGWAAFGGDDGLLTAITRILGEEGFRVVGAHEIMNEVLAPEGLLTRRAPDDLAVSDIRRGIAVVQALGAADVGQCCVVQQGLVLAVEAAEGTDAMLARAGALARPGPGGVLVKLVKPGQERRADLPTIGPATIENAIKASLRGLAIEAGGTMIAERQRTIDQADTSGLFIIGVDPDALLGGDS
ncbi:MAG: UDP-2,3-diacylglucosamine diphosphatase LpxI [Acetobacteraceae bacterium]|nr:UDP-2,3-diacylglucosamine diphosphatase LpxI [Acetobacteraceae bacterium]